MCAQVPSSSNAAARALLALEGRHVLLAYSGHAGKALERARGCVVAAAKAFTRNVRLGARAQPQTQEDILREILRVQQEQLTLLRALLVSSLPASSSSSGPNHSSLPVRPVVLFQRRVLAVLKGDMGFRGPRPVCWHSQVFCFGVFLRGWLGKDPLLDSFVRR